MPGKFLAAISASLTLPLAIGVFFGLLDAPAAFLLFLCELALYASTMGFLETFFDLSYADNIDEKDRLMKRHLCAFGLLIVLVAVFIGGITLVNTEQGRQALGLAIVTLAVASFWLIGYKKTAVCAFSVWALCVWGIVGMWFWENTPPPGPLNP